MLNILLVEDEPGLRESTQFLLESYGHRSDVAENGKIAVEKCSNANDYDLILMDVRMPVMNGIEATKAIRQLEAGKSRTPIVALTAESMEIKERCLAVGMDEFLPKPLDLNALEAILHKISLQCSLSEARLIPELPEDTPTTRSHYHLLLGEIV